MEVSILTDDLIDLALKYFDTNYNCAQSTFCAILNHKGLEFYQAPFLAAGFGGGLAYSGNQCGVVAGSIMAIGVSIKIFQC
jgi:C_GCAxxG_C_C family probable redox protein